MTDPKGVLREKSLQLYKQYERLFAEGQKRGEIRTDQKPLHLAEMLEGMLILIAGNWVSGWWENRSDSLEERFMNAINVFLEGCSPAKPYRRARLACASWREDHVGKKSPPSLILSMATAALPKRDAHVIIPEPPENDGRNASGVLKE